MRLPGLLLLSLLLTQLSVTPPAAAQVPATTRQLVVVRAPGWGAREATLTRYTRASADGPWKAVGGEVEVSLGKRGLAWGRGVAPADPARPPARGPAKKEGDGKTPAGLFRLTEATGAAAAPPEGTRLGYRPSADLVCVDDPASRSYNRIVPAVDPDWRSSESMAMPVVYDLTVFVAHNPEAVAGGGSCIFLHVWRGPGRPTVGCTAMDRAALEALLSWLDPDAEPLLAVLPAAAYTSVREPWHLP